MDRNKMGSNRSQKKMGAHLSNEFFALGTKNEGKGKPISSKGVLSGAGDRKRESTSTISNVTKKLKTVPSSLRPTTSDATPSTSSAVWEQMAVDCDPIELVETVLNAASQQENDNVLRLICGAIKQLTQPSIRIKSELVLYVSLLYLAKIRPSLFSGELITAGLLSVLRRKDPKPNNNASAHVIASNLLTRSYDDKSKWPESFIRVYIEDAVNERVWVDSHYCRPFIDNVVCDFKTRTPPQSLLHMENAAAAATAFHQVRDNVMVVDDDSGDNSAQGMEVASTSRSSEHETELDRLCSVRNRYQDNFQLIENLVVEAIKEMFNRRQPQDCHTRNILKFLCTTAGVTEVRSLSISRLELWIHNGKLVKFAQKLLAYICFNIDGKTKKDHEVLACLVKMRLKAKHLINFYMACLKEMIVLQPDILCVVLKLVVQNELSNTRNPNNMGMLATIFQTAPEQAASFLAEIYKEFLLQRDDCLRTLRVFLRELVRMLRFDVNIVKFVKVLLNERTNFVEQIEQSDMLERVFHSMVDLTCLCMLLSVSPQVREACLALRATRDSKSNAILLRFCTQMSQMQLEAVSWMYETVPNVFKVQSEQYNHALHKILLLENPEQYSRCDQWPSEPERTSLLRLASETPVHEETLLRIILIGITKDIPFTIPDTIDIIMNVVKRASTMRISNVSAIQTTKLDIIDFLFSMTEYHHPENIRLPANYEPPKLAITALYWKAWLIMLMISAHNPSRFGAFCWTQYPMMKMLIEMCITNQFEDHVATKDELQIATVERSTILELETYLAAQTSQAVITEENAILISQLMMLEPMGAPRKIPIAILEHLKNLNKTLKLGHLLCRSRKPDMLLEIIQRHGTTQSMPWLSDLVQNSEGDLSHLPVQCLCEFLLFNANIINEDNSRDAELVHFLRNLVMGIDSNKHIVCEVLDYIFRRLASTVKQSRTSALGGVKIIFKATDSDEIENDWLLRSITQIPHFKDVRSFIIPHLRAACQVENCPELVMSYIQFIASHTLDDPVVDMLDHVIDMAQLIVERNTLFQHIIPSFDDRDMEENSGDLLQESRFQTLKCLFVMFNNYIIKLREHQEPYEWTEYPDLLMVQFDDGVQLPLHLNIIHAFIILLTHANNTMPESIPILDYWFPPDRPPPTAFFPNNPHEPVQLLPDWLKLKMIRSSVERLIEAALRELTPDQIVLFVQNFGTPVNSMSKLLALLDHAVIEQFEAVKGAILNKAYLAQLIEIQQTRGAKNGHLTVQALGLHSHSQTVPDFPKPTRPELEAIDFDDLEGKMKVSPPPPPSSNVLIRPEDSTVKDDPGEVVQNILLEPYFDASRYSWFRQIIHYFYDQFSNATKTKDTFMAKTSISSLIALFADRVHRLSNAQKLHAFTYFRTLLRYCESNLTERNDVIKILGNDMQSSKEFLTLPRAALEVYLFTFSLYNIFNKKNDSKLKKPTKKVLSIIRNEKVFQKILNLPSKVESENITEVESVETCFEDILNCNGLLVDWLSEADPEITLFNKDMQKRFLFSKTSNDFRFYLLSLLCHQANWETLVSTFNYLLEEFESDLDPSTVLNFFEAVLSNPKLWQGRDKYVSKSVRPEYIFVLSENERNVFIKYILNENISESNLNAESQNSKLYSRVNLLFKVTNIRSHEIENFVQTVKRSPCSEALIMRTLQQIYLMFPSVKFVQCIQLGDKTPKLQSLKGSNADKVTNYLITCLGNLVSKKDYEAVASDTELLLRKLAASHPALFLRQLGVLASLIHGRAHISIRALREEYHFHRFIQIIRTLELLQPHMFNDVYKQDLQVILSSYFSFFKHHSNIKEAYHILIKFVELLQNYININPSSALGFIEQYVGILMELAAKFHSLAALHKLVQGIALLQHKAANSMELSEDNIKQEFDLDEQTAAKPPSTVQPSAAATESEIVDVIANVNTPIADFNSRGVVSFAISTSCNRSNVTPHFLNLIKVIKTSNMEEAILAPLQEIESLTSKRFSFLNELFDRLLELIFSHSAQIRSNAFILLIRHLKHNPGRADLNRCTLNAYIQCLRDDNSSVAATAVDNLPEMTLLLQEHAFEILAVAFSLGIKSRLNTSTQIKRVMQTIMLQYGY